jgi:hypothetical protein
MEEILLGGHGDNNKQSQYCKKKIGSTVPLAGSAAQISLHREQDKLAN